MVRVCVVCTGNICRSPVAAAILRQLAQRAGVPMQVESAGVAGYHVGEPADPRSRAVARAHGVEVDTLAQRFTADLFERFDWVLPVDRSHAKALRALARTDAERAKVRLLRSFDPLATAGAEVPDPYYGELEGFEQVHAICERACRGVLAELSASARTPERAGRR